MLLILLAVGTVGFATASVLLLVQLGKERERARAEADLRREQESQLAQLESTRDLLERDLQELRWSQSSRGVAQAGGSIAFVHRTVIPSGPLATQTMPQGLAQHRRDPLKNPVERASLCAQQHINARNTYGELAREMRLPPEKAEELLELLAEQHMRIIDHVQQESIDPATYTTASRTQIRRANEAELAALLGPEGFKQYEQYRRTLGERSQLRAIREQLDAVNMPLRPMQCEQLLGIMIEEAQATARPARSMHLPAADNMEKLHTWLQEYEQCVRARAQSILSLAQMRQLDRHLDRLFVMRRRNLLAIKARRSPSSLALVQAFRRKPDVH